MKRKADFVYGGTFEFDPNITPIGAIEYERAKYIRGILPQIEELKKEILDNKKVTTKEKKGILSFLLKTRLNHRKYSFDYGNGEIYPKEVSSPDIRLIQYPEPHVLITDIYQKEEEWYRLRSLIKDFAEEAYLSYEKGFWLSSISSAINCCEYIIKYELFRLLREKNKEKLEKASKDYNFTLGQIKDNKYNCLDDLSIKLSFYDKLDYLNLVRSSIYHFNPEKERKIKARGKLEIEKILVLTDDMMKPILAFRIYSIMQDLIDHFYSKEKALEYVKECISDWMNKRGLKESDLL